MNNQKMKWWEDSVDEIFIGAFVCVVAVCAIIFLGDKGAIVASAAVSGLCAYLGSRGGQDKHIG